MEGQLGHIIIEYHWKNIDSISVRTLADICMQLQFGTSLPIDLRITAIAGIADGIQYLLENIVMGYQAP